MKKILISRIITLLLVTVFVPAIVMAQRPQPGLPASKTPMELPAAYPATMKYNYLRTWTPNQAYADPAAVKAVTDVKLVHLTTQYFDGLGREIQKVEKGQSFGLQRDLVTPIVYDNVGRPKYHFAQYAAPTGSGVFKLSPFTEQDQFYDTLLTVGRKNKEDIYYGETIYERSPLNRVQKELAPGNNWQGSGRGESKEYLVNTATEDVRIWVVGLAAGAVPVSTAAYPTGTLTKLVDTDESGSKNIIYKDKNDRLILKKVQLSATPGINHSGWLCTYYVYDDLGNQRYIITPKAVELLSTSGWTLTEAIRTSLCFRYEYDHRNRMIVKQLPGAGQVEMVYDVRDRLVLTRDGLLRDAGQNQWLATLYDDQNRPVMTGFYTTTQTHAALQTAMSGTVSGATVTTTIPAPADLVVNMHDGRTSYVARNTIELINGFETTGPTEIAIDPAGNQSTETTIVSQALPGLSSANIDPLTYTYYDNYSFPGAKPAQPGSNPDAAITVSYAVRGLETGTKVRVLGTNQWLTTTQYYDSKGKVIQELSDNYSGGTDILTQHYDFSGQLTSSHRHHRNARSTQTPATTILNTLAYDQAGRLTKATKKLNGLPALQRDIVTFTYNALGRLESKTYKRADGSRLETLDYNFNIRGWIKSINRDYAAGGTGRYFGLELNYDHGFENKEFNGNIAGVNWRGTTDPVQRAYSYGYDRTGRFLKAMFTERTSGGVWDQSSGVNYNVLMGDGADPLKAYDANGNILGMQQFGIKGTQKGAQVDKLVYTYDAGNKLVKVKDDANDPSTTLGDFKHKVPELAVNYYYDGNGNMIRDDNKGILSVRYNHLNLPEEIDFGAKGKISYRYDAAGVKLEKIVEDKTGSTPKTTRTQYMADLTYEDDVLKYIMHSEGRIRVSYPANQPITYTFDYFIKDHQNNVRMVLTEATQPQQYLASMEPERAAVENALFSNVDASRVPRPAGYPEDGQVKKNDAVARLNAKDPDRKIGPALVLRVVTGDTVKLGTKAFYKSAAGQKPQSKIAPVGDMAAALVRAFGNPAGAVAAGHAPGAGSPSTPFTENFVNDNWERMKQKENKGTGQPERLRAYLNYVLFDEQFNIVESGSGVRQVAVMPDELQTLAKDDLVMEKSGFLYIYASNESEQDVYFDNLAVELAPGPVLEETHYYPFGLTMAGISFKPVNIPENRSEKFQAQPFDNELGLDWYGFRYRNHDPQIGRFMQLDPLAEEYVYNSTYAFSENKVVVDIELEGLEKFNSQLIFRQAGITTATTQRIESSINGGLAKVQPIAQGTMTVMKYTAIGIGIASGNPAAIILGIPALGLNLAKDIALAKNPDNKTAQAMPTGVGEASGLVLDKGLSAVGVDTRGTLQDLGGLTETVLTGKDIKEVIMKKPQDLVKPDKIMMFKELFDGFKKMEAKWEQIQEEQKKREKLQEEKDSEATPRGRPSDN